MEKYFKFQRLNLKHFLYYMIGNSLKNNIYKIQGTIIDLMANLLATQPT